MTPAERAAVRFFADNAGYCTPPGRMVCARDLARAEREASELGLGVQWEDDDTACWEIVGTEGPKGQYCSCCHGLTGHRPTVEHPDWEHYCTCEPMGAMLVDESNWPEEPVSLHESLWGICGADRDYRRVVAAELFLEHLAPLWKELARYDALLARVAS